MITRKLSVKKEETGSEPITLEMLQEHLSIDFDDHATLLNVFIPAAREQVEKYTGLSLIDSDITARWESLTEKELPYGPVKEIVSVQDKDDEDITSHTVEGIDFLSITANSETPVVVKYKTGYDVVPFSLQLAIIKLASDHFENRNGIAIGGSSLPNDWKATCRPHSRKSWLG